MELDELKNAWTLLDRRLEAQSALNLHLFRESRLDRVRSRLRPLFWGQLLQIAFGVAVIGFAVSFWTQHRDVPHLLVAGVGMQAYGVLTIIAAAATLVAINGVDYAAPVLAIQERLARLRRTHVVAGMVAGLPWWLLWIPAAMMLVMGAWGVDLYAIIWANAPSVIWSNVAVGIAGLAASLLLLKWARDPRRPRLAKAVEGVVIGRSLREAQKTLDEIVRFERE